MTDYVIEAQAHTRYRVRTADGRPLRLAIIDEAGNVIAAGGAVAETAWDVAIAAHENMWAGKGWLTVRAEGGISIKDRKVAA